MKKGKQTICVLATAIFLGSGYPISTEAAPGTNQGVPSINKTTLATNHAGSAATPTAQATHQSADQQKYIDLTPEEATKLAGFSVKLPGYLPKGDYYLASVSYSPVSKNAWVTFNGKDAKDIYLKMWKGDIRKETIGLKEIAYPKGKAYFGKLADQFASRNVLMWEEEKGVIYLVASRLEMSELDKIAQSMGKGDYATIKKGIPVKGFKTTGNITVQQASEMIGIPVKLPTYPANGKPGNIFYTISYGDEEVLIMYDIPGQDAFLDIEIKKADLKEEYKKVPLIDPPHPNGKAIPFENDIAYTFLLRANSLAKPELKHFNGFMWQEDKGVVYKMISDLPYEELMKIASSIK